MDYEKYYLKQAGTGLSGYQGQKYTLKTQRGFGVWGTIMQYLLPSLKYLGKHALNTGLQVADDVLNKKSNIKDSIKNRGKETSQQVLKDVLKKVNESKQVGNGSVKRKRKQKFTKKKLKLLSSDLKRTLNHV